MTIRVSVVVACHHREALLFLLFFFGSKETKKIPWEYLVPEYIFAGMSPLMVVLVQFNFGSALGVDTPKMAGWFHSGRCALER